MHSPSSLIRFLECAHCAWLDLDPPGDTAADDPETDLVRQKGLEHERAYREKLVSEGRAVVDIPESSKNRPAKTLEAMASGAEVIYQAALVKEPWFGYADFLRRVDAPSDLGDYGYEVLDTKLARNPSAARVIQLCCYSDMLESAQGAAPRAMHLVLGDGAEARFVFNDFRHYYDEARLRFEAFAADPPGDSYPRRCRYCDLCCWREHCAARWEEDDHLTLVAGIRRSQIDRLNDAGVATVRDLGGLEDGARVTGMTAESLARLRGQARLQARKRDAGEDAFELLPPRDGKGFARLPRPDPADLFFDIEGDPYYSEGLEYLFGIYGAADGEPSFRAFWAHDHDEEREAFRQVVDFVAAHLERNPGAHVYHYNHYEETALKRLAARYGTREHQVDNLLRHHKLVDLYKVVREGIQVSEPSYSLKNLETFHMEKREGEVTSAGESIVVYERWRMTRDEALLEQIRKYNEDDCRSTLGLRDWLLGLRPEETPWFDASEIKPDEQKTRDQLEAEERRAERERKLLESSPEGEETVRELVSQLLEFHRREAKPRWWAMFDRRDRETEDLVEDAECLGGLKQSAAPEEVDRSVIYTYRFPAQETKLEAGDDCVCAATLEPAGIIVSLDDHHCVVRIRRSAWKPALPKALSIIPGGPIRTEVLRNALYRFADAVIAGEDRYAAVRSLLLREAPRIRGVKAGKPIVRAPDDILEETIRAVAGMRESCLLIQGPPGAGKTYTSSRVIVKLMDAGRRVGVSSNSHKAINNLLKAVEETARESGVSFRGVKKSTANRPETFFNGDRVEDVTDAQEAMRSVNLLAGTAWLFARQELDQEVDYLFVDEAGQVSLANIVAMGMCARNIVLVGDQMQLGQPIQGVHPGESGLSVLEYLLGDTATVPPERGIFLPTTWRMHEDVCRFISDAVYDGRLHPEPQCNTQRLILREHAHPELRPTGLRFVEVEHEGCSQKSEEEARAILEIYGSLLEQQYIDRRGEIHGMNGRNILVVAPYNVQVNYLKSVLPAGARVGTVDKFQGQEAEAVIVSMTTSSGEDLPRGIEFLFSRNRLNVAISRARCLAVLVASPRLLATPCRTVEELRLVDTLCRARG